MQFDEYLKQAVAGGELQIAASWGQGRTTFGGLSAAIALEAMTAEEVKADPDKKRLLRSLNINFCGPLLVEQLFNLQQQTLSQGKSISQRNGQVLQNGNVVTQVTACYGASRESDIAVSGSQSDLLEQGIMPPEKGMRIRFMPGITPDFVQNIDFSVTEGDLTFSGSEKTSMAGWMRFANAPEDFHESHLVALIDSWPPVAMQMMKKPGPASSVTWNLELMQPLPKIETNEWLYYRAEIKQAANGYAHTDARVYKSDGTLLALSRQLVTIYDKK